MRVRWFQGILAWVTAAGIILVVLAITVVNVLDKSAIEEDAAQNMQAEFSRAAASVSRIIGKSGDIHDTLALQEAFQDIFELRPGIRRLSVYEVSSEAGLLIVSSEPSDVPTELTAHERTEIEAGHSAAQFENSPGDRAWVITAPIILNGQIVGALRGRYSLWKYDRLIRKEGQVAKEVLVGAVVVTCLVFLVLIRLMVHLPLRALLDAMRRAEAGDLSSQATIAGSLHIKEIASQYNRMLCRIRKGVAEREQLLGEIQTFNDTLKTRVAQATRELCRANLKLVETTVQAERAEKLAALGELSAVVAHELGNPLNSISGHLQLLMKETDRPEWRRHLTIIRSEIDRMVATIQHILESTRLHALSAPVDLNGVIRGIEGLIGPSISGKPIVVKTDLAAHLPPVAGDQRALHGMVFNLVTNAVQAMPKGGELTLKTRHAVDDRIEGVPIIRGSSALKKGAARLVLRDTGRGIPPEQLNRIFEPFFTTRAATGGTGLGLAICHRVVSSLGGRMTVHSALDHGTSFTIDLPIWIDPGTGDSRDES